MEVRCMQKSYGWWSLCIKYPCCYYCQNCYYTFEKNFEGWGGCLSRGTQNAAANGNKEICETLVEQNTGFIRQNPKPKTPLILRIRSHQFHWKHCIQTYIHKLKSGILFSYYIIIILRQNRNLFFKKNFVPYALKLCVDWCKLWLE